LQHFPDPLVEPTSKGREGKEEEWEKGRRVKSYILLPHFFGTFSNILGVITYVINCGDGSERGEKQFKYVTTWSPVPPG